MKALILGATGGIGSTLSKILSERGWDITARSRTNGLDLTDQNSVADIASDLSSERYDLIFNATGALVINGVQPEKSLASVDAETMSAQFALNATGVALALRYFSPLLAHQDTGERAAFASISARVGSIGDNRLGGWISYRAAKAAQNQIIHTAAIEIARRHKGAIVVALHPGTVETSLTRRYAERYPTITPERSVLAMLSVLDGLSPKDTGTFWDWKGQQVPW